MFQRPVLRQPVAFSELLVKKDVRLPRTQLGRTSTLG